MVKKFLLILTILLGLGFIAQPASAIRSEDIALIVTPTNQTIELLPGQEKEGKVSISNFGQEGFSVKLSAAPFQVDSETYDVDLSTNNLYTQLHTWITFPEETYYLAPGETKEAVFRVNVPEGTAGGGQYAAILVRSEDGVDPNSSGVQTIPQIASLLYGRIDGPEMAPSGEIAEQTIPSFIFGGPLNVSETVYNTGNVDFKVYHAITITDAISGEEIVTPISTNSNGNTYGSQTTVVLPGTSRSNTLTWENTPKIGAVRVKQTIRFLDQEINTEQLVIFCPIWLIVGVLVLIVLAVFWIILAARHRKRKQPQVF